MKTSIFRWLQASALSAALLMLAGAPAQAQNASTWETVKSTGTLRVGAAVAPPWFIKKTDGTWAGFGTSLAQAMAKALNVELEMVETTWGNAIASLQARQIDAMPVLDPTPERAGAVSFPSNPLLYFSLGVLLHDNASLGNWDDLNDGKFRIGVVQGTSIDAFLRQNNPQANVLRFPGRQELVAAFQSRRVDGISLYHPALVNMAQTTKMGTVVLPKPFRAAISSVAVRKETDMRFVNWLDSSIAFWYASQDVQKWFDEALREQGVDPADSPPIQRELWQ